VLPETRERVQGVIDSLGYRPNRAARNLASARNPVIGLIISDITNSYYPEIVRGVESTALEHDYQVMLHNTDSKPERERQALTLLEEHRADGVIICAPRMDAAELLPLLKQQRTAIVVNRMLPPEIAGIVRVDDRHGARLATQHLVDAGYHYLGYMDTVRSPYSGPERFAGFRSVLEQHNLPLSDKQVLSCHPRVEDAFATAKRLLAANPGLQGIVCFNDLVAAGTLRACHDDHIAVPGDVAVVGFDGIPISALLIPSLTTVFVDRFALGQTAAQLLIDRLNGITTQAEIVLQPQLVIRETSTPLQKGQ
jgi:LacI family transcriptional regulator